MKIIVIYKIKKTDKMSKRKNIINNKNNEKVVCWSFLCVSESF